MINSLTYNGQKINQRADGYVNLGELCATHGKKYANWSRLDSSQAYLEALAETLTESESHIWEANKLVIPDTNAIGGYSGTWGHPLVAIEVARWISPKFGVWCNIHIKTLIETGSTAI
ncbi:MAG: KilA-N domain-containing protein, partial [Planktothrix sp.]